MPDPVVSHLLVGRARPATDGLSSVFVFAEIVNLKNDPNDIENSDGQQTQFRQSH